MLDWEKYDHVKFDARPYTLLTFNADADARVATTEYTANTMHSQRGRSLDNLLAKTIDIL